MATASGWQRCQPCRQCRRGGAEYDRAGDRGVAVIRVDRVVRDADATGTAHRFSQQSTDRPRGTWSWSGAAAPVSAVPDPTTERGRAGTATVQARRSAWEWAEANRAADGSLPSGKAIAARFGRQERWGRLVKRDGMAGQFSPG
jgi:hypothetical protein